MDIYEATRNSHDEAGAERAEERASNIRRGYATRFSPYDHAGNEFHRARNEERNRREAQTWMNAYGWNPAERVPDWERSREERRREGREASAVRQREVFAEHPMLGNIPNMLTDGQVLVHARNAAPMQTEYGREGALAAQLLLLDSLD